MQKIIPHLWFDKQAEEAAQFYTSIFENSNMGKVTRYGKAGYEVHGMPEGTVLTVEFTLEGYSFLALNGGPVFTINPSISFIVNCTSREEVDGLWEKLIEGGKALMPLDRYPFSEHYGWVQDKYGVSWQLILSNPEGDERPKITPSLLFVGDNAGKAEEAMTFYTSLFENARIGNLFRYGPDQAPDKEGTIMYGDFTLAGQWFAAMDSAHEHRFAFNEAISLLVNCKSQQEIDTLWEKLSAVPASEQCGWLKDKYGVSWQIVPTVLSTLLSGDPQKAERVMETLLQMKKLDIAKLQETYDAA